MTESPRRLAELILARDGAWIDADAEAVASAYLELLDEAYSYLLWAPRQKGHAAAHTRFSGVVVKAAA